MAYSPMSYNGIQILKPIDTQKMVKEIEEDQMWADIRRLAKTSPALQEALDKALSIYILTKPNNERR
jgi:hypothetical protein